MVFAISVENNLCGPEFSGRIGRSNRVEHHGCVRVQVEYPRHTVFKDLQFILTRREAVPGTIRLSGKFLVLEGRSNLRPFRMAIGTVQVWRSYPTTSRICSKNGAKETRTRLKS